MAAFRRKYNTAAHQGSFCKHTGATSLQREYARSDHKALIQMNPNESSAHQVILELRRYRDRIDDILERLEGKRLISADEKADLQALLTSLKSDLKEAAKRGTVGVGREPQTPFERAFFAPAVQSASARFRVAVNSHPIRSDWFGCLYEVQIDITHPLHQLEQQFPSV